MLEKISWPAYLAGILVVTLIYYSWVILTYFRPELAAVLQKRIDREETSEQNGSERDHDVIGKVIPDDEQIVDEAEIQFGPPEEDEPLTAIQGQHASDQVSDFSEMVSEVKTLIRVIAESAENREYFDLLFGLIIQKYRGLSDSSYREKINAYLLEESNGRFPFTVTDQELNQLWDEHFNH